MPVLEEMQLAYTPFKPAQRASVTRPAHPLGTDSDRLKERIADCDRSRIDTLLALSS